MPDGSIVFSTELDNKELEKQLGGLSRKIDRINDKINQKQAERTPLAEQSKQLAAQLDAAKARLEYMKSGEKFFTSFSVQNQEAMVGGMQKEWDSIQNKVEKYDEAIKQAAIELNRNKEKAGAISQQLSHSSTGAFNMGSAVEKAGKSMQRFQMRLREVVRSALIFTLISRSLASLRDWIGSVIRVNAEASQSVARLKAALLTLAQPLVSVVIPAFTAFVNILSAVIYQIAKVVSILFGTTIDKSKESAAALNKQTTAIKGTGSAAKGAAKQAEKYLATFDEINQIGDKSDSGSGDGGGVSGGGIAPDFGALGGTWLKDTLGEAAGWVTAGLLLGGLTLVALGAAIGSLPTVLAGLLLLSAGVSIGTETGVLQSWVDTLGLESVQEFLVAAMLLGGIAIVAIGAALGNIGMVIAGLVLLGATLLYAEKSGQMQDWRESLGLSKVPAFVTIALLLGGIALIAFGAMTKNMLAVIAGIGLLSAGVYVGKESGTFQKWWEALNLPQVAQWVTAALLLGGIGLLAFGIVTKNIKMSVAGLGMLGAGVAFGLESGTLQKWWEALNLPQVAQWVTAALLLGGIGLLVIGIATGNLPMLLFGLGLLGTAITFGITSGTFSKWIEDIKTGLSQGWADIKSWWATEVAPKLTISFWEDQFSNIGKALISKIKDSVNGGITLFNRFIDWLNSKMRFTWDSFEILGQEIIPAGSVQLFTIPKIPMLAQGAVIPPNREFLAMLGDQKSGVNIEAPLDTIVAAFKQANREGGGGGNRPITVILEVDKREFGRVVYEANNDETQRVGVVLA